MRIAGLTLVAASICIAGCGQQAAPPPKPAASAQSATPTAAEAEPDTVHAFMTKRIDPYADIIWGIGNAAMNDEAGIDPARMSPDNWRVMQETAEKMAVASRALGALQPIRVVDPGELIVDEGKPRAPIAAHVQAHIDAGPDQFRAMAALLEQHGRDLAVAAGAKDAATAGRLVNEIDQVCETCHLQFWYPEDRKILEAMAKKK